MKNTAAALLSLLMINDACPSWAVPPVPTGLTAAPVSSSQINLAWSAGGGTISSTNCPQPPICSTIACPTSTNWINPLNYGAVGDGSHDDTSAIQSASNAGDVCFPPGYTFLITSNPSINMNQTGRHWQGAASGGTGSAMPVIKLTNYTTGNGWVKLNAGSQSVIYLDFEGTNGPPAHWVNQTDGWSIPLWSNGNGGGLLIAGNKFNAFFGQAGIEFYGGSSCTDMGNSVIAYNNFSNCGIYATALDAVSNVLVHDNTIVDCADGVENDTSSQCASNLVFNRETLTAVNGGGYSGECNGVYLTGGSTAGANYSGVTVENSAVSGSGSCIYESSSGLRANYINDTCTNGCGIR